jgi:hypothetical protein
MRFFLAVFVFFPGRKTRTLLALLDGKGDFPATPKPFRTDSSKRFDFAVMSDSEINQVAPFKEIWVMMKLNSVTPAILRHSPMALSYGHSAWILSSSGLFNRFPG